MAERKQCPKCESCAVNLRYRRGNEWWRVPVVHEHLECRCDSCGFRWTEPVLHDAALALRPKERR